MSYEELKAKRDTAQVAHNKAWDELESATVAFREALIERNRQLPDGLYFECPEVLGYGFPVYLKVGGGWFLHNGTEFDSIPWFDHDENSPDVFDIEVISINDLKFQ